MQLKSKANADAPQKKQQIFSFWGLVMIFGIFGTTVAVSLPSLMSCGNKAKQAEAKSNIGAMNRAQQVYFLEKNTFTNSVVETGVGIQTQTVNYDYSVRATKTAVFNYGILRQKKQNLKSYVGAVFVVPATNLDSKANKEEKITIGILCETIKPGSMTPSAPTLVKGVLTCSADTQDLNKG